MKITLARVAIGINTQILLAKNLSPLYLYRKLIIVINNLQTTTLPYLTIT